MHRPSFLWGQILLWHVLHVVLLFLSTIMLSMYAYDTFEDIFLNPLKCVHGIFQPKMRVYEFKEATRRGKGCFFHLFILSFDLPESWVQVKLCEHFSLGDSVQHIDTVWEWIAVPDCHIIQLSVIDIRSPYFNICLNSETMISLCLVLFLWQGSLNGSPFPLDWTCITGMYSDFTIPGNGMTKNDSNGWCFFWKWNLCSYGRLPPLCEKLKSPPRFGGFK